MEGAKRSELIRQRSELKLEGDIERRTTEISEQFVAHPIPQGSQLEKRSQGGGALWAEEEPLATRVSETFEKFVAHENVERRTLKRHPTNLHMEGETTYLPEYTQQFVDFPRYCTMSVEKKEKN